MPPPEGYPGGVACCVSTGGGDCAAGAPTRCCTADQDAHLHGGPCSTCDGDDASARWCLADVVAVIDDGDGGGGGAMPDEQQQAPPLAQPKRAAKGARARQGVTWRVPIVEPGRAEPASPPPLLSSRRRGFEPYRRGLTKKEAAPYVTYPYVLGPVYTSGGTYRRCLAALFEWHAETLNAWTMIWASCLSVFLLRHALAAISAGGPAASAAGSYWPGLADSWPFWLNTAATVAHMPFSVGFHLFRGMGPQVYSLWRRLDQVMIFQVSQPLTLSLAWFVYTSWQGLALNVAAAVLTAQLNSRAIAALPPDYQRPRWRSVAFVSSIVLCYFFPLLLQAWRDVSAHLLAGAAGAGPAPPLAAAGYAAGALLSLVAGAALFATGLPERALPGAFDLVGFSHQLMHLAVAAAHVFEFAFVLELCARRRREALMAVA